MAHDTKNRNPKSNDTARDASAPPQRRIRNQSRGSGETADFGTLDAQKVLAVIATLAGRGCAIQFGYTRDGGAYSFRIVGDGEPYNEYVRPTESVDLYLDSLLLDFGK